MTAYLNRSNNVTINHEIIMKMLLTLPTVPPTYVNVTANKEDKTLTLECTTDSSNPVAMLNWYKGDDNNDNNSIITSSYQPVIVDAEYDGKNITQSLDINAVNIKEGEMAFCCAKQLNTEICQSFY
jgi:hypothetical protein